MVAVELWALCFEHLRNDTGEVLLSREQMAEEVGVAPKRVSEVMSELVKIGAIFVFANGCPACVARASFAIS